MSQYFCIHPENPQPRLIKQAAQLLRQGGIAALPTDCCYVLAAALDNKSALERLRQLRQLDDKHLFSLLCRDLSEIATYAFVDNAQYRTLKSLTPGCYTFILEATREVPRRLNHAARKTVGLRVPANPIVQALLAELGAPLLGTTLILPGFTEPLTDPQQIRTALEKQIDLVVDGGAGSLQPTTVVDFTQTPPMVLRAGLGSIDAFV